MESCKKPTYAAGPSNRTPLHAAVIQEHKDYIRSQWRWNKPLCEEPDLWGWNSLNYAVKLGLEDVVSDMMGWTKSLVKKQNALHVDEVVRFLLDSNKCDNLVDELDSDGNIPLHLLAASGNHMHELIHHPRAKKMSFNKQNQTPLDIALSCKATTKKEKLVEDLCSIGWFGKRDFEVKQKYEYMPNPNDDTGTGAKMQLNDETGIGVKMQLREDDHDKAKKVDKTVIESIMKVAQIHVVVATLIMIVTFAAGITLLGGFESDSNSHNQGMAVLIRKIAFSAFVFSNAIAFTFSSVAIFIYFLVEDESRNPQHKKIVRKIYDLADICQCLSLLAVVIAFTTGYI
ncbi:hypothetical protein P3S68_024970 [Capsicum galapagoense]